MRFMIHGADQKTGREMTIVMEAPDESEAERRALYNDILVSSVARFTAGAATAGEQPSVREDLIEERTARHGSPLSYHYRPAEIPPEQRGAAPPNPDTAAVPAYRDVLDGARWLDRLGLVARWGGGFAIVTGLGLIALACFEPIRQRLVLPAHPVLYLTAAAVVTTVGLLCVICGVLVSMTSGLVVAVRDIAQNTFHVAATPAPPAARVETLEPQRDFWVLSASEMSPLAAPALPPPLVE
jgi:hypothetical protein